MKNKKAVKILFALLIMLFFVLISKSFSSVDAATFGPDFAHSYSMSGGGWTAYCREEGKALGGNIGGNPINALEYNQDSGMQHIEYIVVQVVILYKELFGIQRYGLEGETRL